MADEEIKTSVLNAKRRNQIGRVLAKDGRKSLILSKTAVNKLTNEDWELISALDKSPSNTVAITDKNQSSASRLSNLGIVSVASKENDEKIAQLEYDTVVGHVVSSTDASK